MTLQVCASLFELCELLGFFCKFCNVIFYFTRADGFRPRQTGRQDWSTIRLSKATVCARPLSCSHLGPLCHPRTTSTTVMFAQSQRHESSKWNSNSTSLAYTTVRPSSLYALRALHRLTTTATSIGLRSSGGVDTDKALLLLYKLPFHRFRLITVWLRPLGCHG